MSNPELQRDPVVLRLAAALCGLSVVIGAFGAHGLEGWLTERFAGDLAKVTAALAWWETGARYQMFHGLALLALGAAGWSSRGFAWATVFGAFLFSGSLYGLALGGPGSILGPVTPIGGLLWIGLGTRLFFRPVFGRSSSPS